MKLQALKSRTAQKFVDSLYLRTMQVLDKRASAPQPSPYQLNVKRKIAQSAQNIQTCRLSLEEDGKLHCQSCGLPIPTTPQGQLDHEQYTLEIAVRLKDCPCQACRLPLNRGEA